MKPISTVLSLAVLVLLSMSAAAQETQDDEGSQDAQSPQVLSGIVIPIPQQILSGKPAPDFVGSPAIANPFPATPVPQSPFMAPNGLSGVHLDAYQSDTYTFAGPLGHSPEVTSTFKGSALRYCDV
jgi:hypothetical protein